jgi:hypothetical protein
MLEAFASAEPLEFCSNACSGPIRSYNRGLWRLGVSLPEFAVAWGGIPSIITFIVAAYLAVLASHRSLKAVRT